MADLSFSSSLPGASVPVLAPSAPPLSQPDPLDEDGLTFHGLLPGAEVPPPHPDVAPVDQQDPLSEGGLTFHGLLPGGALPAIPPDVVPAVLPDPLVEDGLRFAGVLPGPAAPPDPLGEHWRGLPGPPGPPGPQGDPGPPPPTYIHTQAVPAYTWSISHGLSGFPAVDVVDSSGRLVEGDVRYVSPFEISVVFSGAFSGFAYLN